jgi:hypothetical protein
MKIASGIDFLLGKNKLQMYDESPKFSGRLKIVLTINAISEKLSQCVGRVSRLEATGVACAGSPR